MPSETERWAEVGKTLTCSQLQTVGENINKRFDHVAAKVQRGENLTEKDIQGLHGALDGGRDLIEEIQAAIPDDD